LKRVVFWRPSYKAANGAADISGSRIIHEHLL
jgi:hypothetical protein